MQCVREELKYAAWYNPAVRFPRVTSAMTGEDLAHTIHRYLQKLGDGHASAIWQVPSRQTNRWKCLWTFERCNSGVVAVRVDTGRLQSPLPVVRVSGIPIAKVLHTVKIRIGVTRGATPSFTERGVLDALQYEWDTLFGVPMVLTFADGTHVAMVDETRLDTRKQPVSEVIDTANGIRVIRLCRMCCVHELPFDLADALRGKCKRIVLDFRNNGGGPRDLILLLASYLSPAPVVGAVARAHNVFGTDFLHDRYMYPKAHFQGDWRKVVASVPACRFPRGKGMSDLHYFVAGPEKASARAKVNVPVSVLMNTHCFSACDIALATLDEIAKRHRPDIRLIGTPSRGGSSGAHLAILSGERLYVRYGAMMSWKVNGDTFDGHGTTPHVVVLPDAHECECPPANGAQMAAAV